MAEARFRYIDENGKERSVLSPADLIAGISANAIGPDTLVFDTADGKWRVAKELNALGLAGRLHQSDVPLPSPPRRSVPRAQSVSRGPAILSAVVWCGAMVLQYRTHSLLGHGVPFTIGAIIGTGGIGALLAVLLSRLPLLRGRKAIAWGLAGVLVLAVGIKKWVDARHLQQELTSAALLVRQAAAGNGTAAANTIDDTNSVTFVMASFLESSQEAWALYTAAVDSAGDAWLSPRALATQIGLEEAFDNIFRVEQAVTALDEGLRLAQASARERMVRLESRNVEWAGVVKGFDQSSGTTMAVVTDFVATERRLMSVAESIVVLVQERRPVLGADGETLLFPSDRDVTHFNRLHGSLQALADSETAIMRRLQAQADRSSGRADSVLEALGHE